MTPKPRRIYGRQRLSRLLSARDTPQALQKATVVGINADGTVDLQLSDGVRRSVDVSSAYTPQAGDRVRVFRADPFSLFVLGTTRDSNATTVTVQNSVLLPYNIRAVNVAAPAPGITTGTAYFNATNSRSYRPLDGWSRPEVYQGAYTSGLGYWRGCYFYGSGPQALRGKIVTSGSIRIHRLGQGGGAQNVPQWIAPHAHANQPGGAPYFTASAHLQGYVDWGQSLELPMPNAWLQSLVNGSGLVRGFGHAINSTGGNYSIAASRASDAVSGRLTIRWRSA